MYPISYQVSYVEKRSRLTTFFRYILAIPWFIVGAVVLTIAEIAALIAWFALVFTTRYPEGLYNFVAGALRFVGRTNGFVNLLTDEYPSFGLDEDPNYPVHVSVAPPKESYSRVKAFFRGIIGIPVIVILYLLILLGSVVGLVSWFAIVFTAKQPEGLQKLQVLVQAYYTRAMGYLLLLTEDWPPFSLDSDHQLGSGSGPTAALAGSAGAPLETPAAPAQPQPPVE